MGTNPPPPAGQGQPTGSSSTLGSMYGAFEECERQARHRKYQIAECEDKIENLQKDLKEIIEKNKNFESQCEKMEIEAKSAETTYQKKLKEKALMEIDYRALSKEMDEVTQDIARKQAQLKKTKLFHQEKIDMINKTEEKNMKEYMKNPKIAEMMALKKKSEELTKIYKEKKLQVERQKEQHKELKDRYEKEWNTCKKKCIQMAELYLEIKKKTITLEDLRTQYEKTFRTAPLGFQARHTQMGLQLQRSLETPANVSAALSRCGLVLPNTSQRLEGYGAKLGLAIPLQRRSSTFQQLDRIVCQSKTEPTNRRTFAATRTSAESGDRTAKYLPICSPMRTGSTLVSQIRSKLKGTVYPMRRDQNAQCEKIAPAPTVSKTSNFSAVAAAPSANEIQGEKTPELPNAEANLAEKTACFLPVDPCLPPPNQVNMFDSNQRKQLEGNTEDASGEKDALQHVEVEKNHDLEVTEVERLVAEPAMQAAAKSSSFNEFQPPMQPKPKRVPPTDAVCTPSTSNANPQQPMINLFGGFSTVSSPATDTGTGLDFFEGMFSTGNPIQTSESDFAFGSFF